MTSERPPLVTAVVCAYNSEPFIDEAIRSMRDQTLRDIEILVIDDGSTDGTPEIIARHAREDPRVRVLTRPNGGLCAARNDGLRAARAPWVALLDGDDVSLPRRLERQWEFVQAHPRTAALGTYGFRIGASGRRCGVCGVGPLSVEHLQRLRAANEPIYLVSTAALISREIALGFGGFRSGAEPAEDIDLWTRMADEHDVLVLPERLILYRVHGASASTLRFFTQMEDALRVSENAARRRRGEPEMDRAQFHARLRAQPIWIRFQRARRWRSQYFYRRAGGLLADRKPSGLLWLAASFALAPLLPLGRMRRQIWPWLFGARS